MNDNLPFDDMRPDMIRFQFLVWARMNGMKPTPRAALKYARLHGDVIPERREEVFGAYLTALNRYIAEAVA